MPSNINPILAQVDKAKVAITKNVATSEVGAIAIAELAGIAGTAGQGIVDTTQSIGVANQIIEAQRVAAIAATENLIADNLKSLGGAEFIAAQSRRLQERIADKNKAVDALKANEAIEITNPFQYLAEGFANISLNAAVDEATAAVASKRADIAALTSSQEAVSKALLTAKDLTTKATVVAEGAKAEALTKIEVDKAVLAAASTDANNVIRGMQASTAQMNAEVKSTEFDFTIENQEARRVEQEMSKTNLQLRIDESPVRMKLLRTQQQQAELNLTNAKRTSPSAVPRAIRENEAASEALDNRKYADAVTASNVQLASAALGLTVPDARFIIDAINDTRTTPLDRTKLAVLASIGGQDDLAIGATPADALENITLLGIGPDTPVARAMAKLVQGWNDQFAAPGAKRPSNRTAEKQSFNEYVTRVTTMQQKEIIEGDSTNPGHAPPLAVLTENYESIKNSKLYKTVPAIREMKEFSIRRIMEAGLAVGDDVISMEDIVSGVEDIVAAAITYNRSTQLSARIGVVPQNSYNQQVPTTGSNIAGAATVTGAALGAAGATLPKKSGARIGKGKAALLIGALTTVGSLIGSSLAEEREVLDMSKKVNLMYSLNKLRTFEAKPSNLLDFIESDPLNPASRTIGNQGDN